MTTQHRTIGFIGAGNMPRSIIGGMIKGGFPANQVIASNPSTPKLDALATDFGVQVTQDNSEVVRQAEVVVLAVKPQLMQEVCTALQQSAPEVSERLVVSIAAGVLTERFHQYFGQQTRVIRVMPNTPSLVGAGVAGLYADQQVSQADKDFVTQVFTYTGTTIWLADEAQIDVLGGVAGSGPAYFFEFMRSLQVAAEDLGMAPAQARAMVQQTALGAASMAIDSQLELGELRDQVMSKGGSTAQGIGVFQQENLAATTSRAVAAAVARNREMAKLF